MMMMMVMMERKEGGGAKQAPTRERRAGRARTQFVFAPTVSPIREERTSSASRGTEEDALALAAAAAPPLHRFLRRGWEMLDPLCAASPLSLSTMIEF